MRRCSQSFRNSLRLMGLSGIALLNELFSSVDYGGWDQSIDFTFNTIIITVSYVSLLSCKVYCVFVFDNLIN